jgi:hypothetical protein
LSVIRQHIRVWLAFARAVVLILSTRKLSKIERDDLLAVVSDFAKEYKTGLCSMFVKSDSFLIKRENALVDEAKKELDEGDEKKERSRRQGKRR